MYLCYSERRISLYSLKSVQMRYFDLGAIIQYGTAFSRRTESGPIYFRYKKVRDLKRIGRNVPVSVSLDETSGDTIIPAVSRFGVVTELRTRIDCFLGFKSCQSITMEIYINHKHRSNVAKHSLALKAKSSTSERNDSNGAYFLEL
jgi:hypothetical protein